MAKPPVIRVDKLGRDILDYAHGEWFGVPRSEVQWGPTVNYEQCIGCGLCYMVCGGRVVYDWDMVQGRPVVARFDNCMPGCTTCANFCPAQAIVFPLLDSLHALRDQHRIVAKARKKVAALKEDTETQE